MVLDRHFERRFGDISEYIGRFGYEAYAGENVATYCSLFRDRHQAGGAALSSGFMTYPQDIHPEYRRVIQETNKSPCTFVLLPSLDRGVCVPRLFGDKWLAHSAALQRRKKR